MLDPTDIALLERYVLGKLKTWDEAARVLTLLGAVVAAPGQHPKWKELPADKGSPVTIEYEGVVYPVTDRWGLGFKSLLNLAHNPHMPGHLRGEYDQIDAWEAAQAAEQKRRRAVAQAMKAKAEGLLTSGAEPGALTPATKDALTKFAKGQELGTAKAAQAALDALGIRVEKRGAATWVIHPDGQEFEIRGRDERRVNAVDALALTYYTTWREETPQEEQRRAALVSLRTRARELAGLEAPPPDDGRPVVPRNALTDFSIRTCPVCFRDIKVGNDYRMVLHGYQRPGTGQVHGSCPGVGEPPFERSPDATRRELAKLERWSVGTVEAMRRFVRTRPRIKTVRKEWRGGQAIETEHWVEPSDPTYKDEFRTTLHNSFTSDLRYFWSGGFGSIPWLRMAIRTWRGPYPDDKPMVGAPQGKPEGSDFDGSPLAEVERIEGGGRPDDDPPSGQQEPEAEEAPVPTDLAPGACSLAEQDACKKGLPIVRVGIPDTYKGVIYDEVVQLGAPTLVSIGSMFRQGRGKAATGRGPGNFTPIGAAAWTLGPALDSAGFTAMLAGGYRWTVEEYVDFIVTNRGDGAMPFPWSWWSAMDYCVEPEIAKDRTEVARRMQLTVDTYGEILDLLNHWRSEGVTDVPDPLPILQGRKPEDYVWSAQAMARVIDAHHPCTCPVEGKAKTRLKGHALAEKLTERLDPAKCHRLVDAGGSWGRKGGRVWQCKNPPTGMVGGHKWCAVHLPEAQEAEEARQADTCPAEWHRSHLGLPELVGLGSVCRRDIHGPEGLLAVLAALDKALDPHVKLHLFGVKGVSIDHLDPYLHRVKSIDSMAWSYGARKKAHVEGVSKTVDLQAKKLRDWYTTQQGRVQALGDRTSGEPPAGGSALKRSQGSGVQPPGAQVVIAEFEHWLERKPAYRRVLDLVRTERGRAVVRMLAAGPVESYPPATPGDPVALFLAKQTMGWGETFGTQKSAEIALAKARSAHRGYTWAVREYEPGRWDLRGTRTLHGEPIWRAVLTAALDTNLFRSSLEREGFTHGFLTRAIEPDPEKLAPQVRGTPAPQFAVDAADRVGPSMWDAVEATYTSATQAEADARNLPIGHKDLPNRHMIRAALADGLTWVYTGRLDNVKGAMIEAAGNYEKGGRDRLGTNRNLLHNVWERVKPYFPSEGPALGAMYLAVEDLLGREDYSFDLRNPEDFPGADLVEKYGKTPASPEEELLERYGPVDLEPADRERAYFITARRSSDGAVAFLAGPFETHREAILAIPGVKAKVDETGLDPFAEAAIGTAKASRTTANVRWPERQYHVVAINERTGFKERLTSYPVGHEVAVRIQDKSGAAAPNVRKQLEEVPGAITEAAPTKAPVYVGQRVRHRKQGWLGTVERVSAAWPEFVEDTDRISVKWDNHPRVLDSLEWPGVEPVPSADALEAAYTADLEKRLLDHGVAPETVRRLLISRETQISAAARAVPVAEMTDRMLQVGLGAWPVKWPPSEKARALFQPLGEPVSWSDALTKRALAAFELFRDDPAEDRAKSVAYGVGAEARRLGVSKDDLSKWLQGAYGSVWVRQGNLNPGLDLRQVREAMYNAYDRAGGAAPPAKVTIEATPTQRGLVQDRIDEGGEASITAGLEVTGSRIAFTNRAAAISAVEGWESIVDGNLSSGEGRADDRRAWAAERAAWRDLLTRIKGAERPTAKHAAFAVGTRVRWVEQAAQASSYPSEVKAAAGQVGTVKVTTPRKDGTVHYQVEFDAPAGQRGWVLGLDADALEPA